MATPDLGLWILYNPVNDTVWSPEGGWQEKPEIDHDFMMRRLLVSFDYFRQISYELAGRASSILLDVYGSYLIDYRDFVKGKREGLYPINDSNWVITTYMRLVEDANMARRDAIANTVRRSKSVQELMNQQAPEYGSVCLEIDPALYFDWLLDLFDPVNDLYPEGDERNMKLDIRRFISSEWDVSNPTFRFSNILVFKEKEEAVRFKLASTYNLTFIDLRSEIQKVVDIIEDCSGRKMDPYG
jgi:hypothetical protein